MDKAELEETIKRARIRLNKIESAESLARNKALVGRCFKYPRNCYSCPSKPSDYWPVYHKIIMGDSSGCRSFTFQTDSKSNIRIEFKDYWHNSGCVSITGAEFDRAWRAVQKRIAKCKP